MSIRHTVTTPIINPTFLVTKTQIIKRSVCVDKEYHSDFSVTSNNANPINH